MVDMDKFESILQSRYTPDPRSNLEERIIAAAARSPQAIPTRSGGGIGAWVSGLFEGLIIPAPAVSMALVLVGGLFIGMNTDYLVQGQGDLTPYSYFMLPDNADYGDLT